MSWNIDVPVAEYFDHKSPNLEALINETNDQKEVALDTETTGLTSWKDIPLYWSLAFGQRRITLNASVLPYFRDVFANSKIDWVFANAKYDCHILGNVGVTLAGRYVDCQVEHALLYEERPHGLKDIAMHILGWRWSDFQDTFGKIGKKQSAEDVIRKAERENFPLLVEYAANDAWGTLNAHLMLKQQLQQATTFSLFGEKPPYIVTLWDLFDKIEVPFTKVLFECERNGIRIDMDYLSQIAPQAAQEINDVEKEINKLAGYVLNPKSPAQLRKYFFDEKGLRPLKMSKGGKTGVRSPSVDSGFLEHYADKGDPMATYVLRHRELSKLDGTYIKGLPKGADPNDRIHTRYNQDIARCMPAGELVLTDKGYLPIEQVKKGTRVLTHQGRPRLVIETSKHKPKPVFNTQLSTGLSLKTTGNHEYLLSNGTWKRADLLQAGDEVVTHSSVEEWSNIPEWPNYSVSSWGRVKNNKTGYIKAQHLKSRWGHLKVSLSRNGAQHRGEDKKDVAVHRIVLTAFQGPSKKEVRHLNGVAWDNTLDNLAYGTSSENTADPKEPKAKFQTAYVSSVEELLPEVTFGLTVEEDHSHVTGGIVTHNTGRLSSADPNLQNIPRPDNDKWKLRGAFVAEEGNELIVADYEQLEMRLLACASLEPGMIEVINKGWDIHMGNASMIFGIPYDEIKAAKKLEKAVKNGEADSSSLTQRVQECLDARAAAKTLGFGLVYGMGPGKLANSLGVSIEAAMAKLEQFKRAYPAVDAFAAEAVQETEMTGYSFTIMGRRRNVPQIGSNRRDERMQAERIAVNTPIQGSAADVVKMAQILCYRARLDQKYGARMLLQVHDELVFECPKETVREAKSEIKEWMEHPFYEDLAVALAVDIGNGRSWMDAK